MRGKLLRRAHSPSIDHQPRESVQVTPVERAVGRDYDGDLAEKGNIVKKALERGGIGGVWRVVLRGDEDDWRVTGRPGVVGMVGGIGGSVSRLRRRVRASC